MKLCGVMWFHVVSWLLRGVMWCYVLTCGVMCFDVALCGVMWRYVVLRGVMQLLWSYVRDVALCVVR